MISGLVKREQSLDLLGTLGDFVEVREVAGPSAPRPRGTGVQNAPFEVDGALGPRLLRLQVDGDETHGQRRGPSQSNDATHEALLDWPRHRAWAGRRDRYSKKRYLWKRVVENV